MPTSLFKLALAAALAALLCGCATAPPALQASDGAVGPAAFRQLLAHPSPQVLIVDVRSSAEHEEGAPTGSRNLPIKTLAEHLDALPADRAIVFYCTSGIRSHRAYDLARSRRPRLHVYWADAYTTCGPDGTCLVEPRTH